MNVELPGADSPFVSPLILLGILTGVGGLAYLFGQKRWI
jgi:Mg2+ and Co2+ transporter CorA